MSQIVLFLILIAEFFTTPHNLLFYDQIEYLRIVTTSTFWQVFSMGHFPIHPVFLAFFWVTTKLIEPNLTAFIFGAISGCLMYLISKEIFKKGRPWVPLLIFSLFPGVWLVNTNLMVHTILLTFYLSAIYFLLKRRASLFLLSIVLMGAVHFDSVYWVPTIFVIPIMFKNELKFKNRDLLKYIILGAEGLLISGLFYASIYLFVRKDLSGSMEQLLSYSSFGYLRSLRNILYGFINSFGTLTPLVVIYLIIKNVKGRLEWLAWAVFAIAVSIGGAYWEGDLMQRRIVFAGVLLALFIYKYFKKWSFLLILYLLPMVFVNGVLYFRENPNMALTNMQNEINTLPKNGVLIQSFYYQPFTKYQGKIIWLGHDDIEVIDGYLKNGTRVFLTNESVTAPYRLLIGNNYHITSLDRIGDSDSRFLFKKYQISKTGEALELHLNKGPDSPLAGKPVIYYDESFWGRLTRRRIDYGDFGVWLWAIATNHRDPTGWTYFDASGNII